MMMELEPVITCRKILISAIVFYLLPIVLFLEPIQNSEGKSKYSVVIYSDWLLNMIKIFYRFYIQEIILLDRPTTYRWKS